MIKKKKKTRPQWLTNSSTHLCDGVREGSDHHAPHPQQLLFVLHGAGAAPQGREHGLRERQRGRGPRQAAAHQRLKALEEPGDGNTQQSASVGSWLLLHGAENVKLKTWKSTKSKFIKCAVVLILQDTDHELNY